ncbi:MAG TPA: hypothetical protein PK239_09630 [Chitinophagales bacterium]|nr:hypothetical protein [Chitinophagales bacterium]
MSFCLVVLSFMLSANVRRITEVPPYLSNHYTTQLPAAFPVIRQLYEVFLLRRMYVNTRIYGVPNGSLLPLPLSF